MAGGYIKLHRKMMNWEWYNKPTTAHLFVHLLLTASHEDCEIRGKGIKRGELFTTLKKLSDETGLTEKQVRISLDELILTENIENISSTKGRMVRIVNYDNYQLKSAENGSTIGGRQNLQKRADKRADEISLQNGSTSDFTEEQILIGADKRAGKGQTKGQIYYIQEEKNKRNIKEKFCISEFAPEEIKTEWLGFVEMRNKIKKPLTERAAQLILSKLEKLSGGNVDVKRKILDQSTEHCWQGVFELKQDKQDADPWGNMKF